MQISLQSILFTALVSVKRNIQTLPWVTKYYTNGREPSCIFSPVRFLHYFVEI